MKVKKMLNKPKVRKIERIFALRKGKKQQQRPFIGASMVIAYRSGISQYLMRGICVEIRKRSMDNHKYTLVLYRDYGFEVGALVTVTLYTAGAWKYRIEKGKYYSGKIRTAKPFKRWGLREFRRRLV